MGKITRPLLESIKQRNRYEEVLKSIEQKITNRAKVKTSQEKNKLLNIDNEIRKIQRGIEVADKAISDGSKKFEQHLASKTLHAEKLHSDNELIQMGLQRKRKLESCCVSAFTEPRKLNRVWFGGFLCVANLDMWVSGSFEVGVRVEQRGHFDL